MAKISRPLLQSRTQQKRLTLFICTDFVPCIQVLVLFFYSDIYIYIRTYIYGIRIYIYIYVYITLLRFPRISRLLISFGLGMNVKQSQNSPSSTSKPRIPPRKSHRGTLPGWTGNPPWSCSDAASAERARLPGATGRLDGYAMPFCWENSMQWVRGLGPWTDFWMSQSGTQVQVG